MTKRAKAALGVAILLLAAAGVMPLTPGGGGPAGERTPTPNAGTVQTPSSGPTPVPDSHVEGDVAPPEVVRATAGVQTMTVEATRRGDDLALVLADDRVHEGRWVEVPTRWFHEHDEPVPEVATVEHSSGATYSVALRRQGEHVQFRVRNFSTNTVTFGGEVRLTAQPAVAGGEYAYDLDQADTVSNFDINITGRIATETDTVTYDQANSVQYYDFAVAGNLDPTGPAVDNSPELTLTAHEVSTRRASGCPSTPSSGAGSVEMDVGTFDYGMTTFAFRQGGSAPSATVDVYVVTNESVDGTTGEGTKVIDGASVGSGWSNLTLSGQFAGGGTVTIEVVSQSGSDLYPCYESAGSDYLSRDGTLESRAATSLVRSDPGPVTAISETGDTTDFGTMTDGQTVTKPINLTTSADDIEADALGGAYDMELVYTERVEPDSPAVEVNGNFTQYNARLSAGETVSLSTDTAWLRDGQNRVNTTTIANPGGGDQPPPEFDLEYSHDATWSVSASRSDEAWTERYSVERVYGADTGNADLTVPMSDSVVAIRAVEYRINRSGAWTSVDAADYTLSGTDLTVDVAGAYGGEIPASTVVEVRANGTKIQTTGGEVTVLEPTAVGTDLDTRIEFGAWGPDARIDVSGTDQGDHLHRPANATYSNPAVYSVYTATDKQYVYAPNAQAGDRVTIRTQPVTFEPVTGRTNVTPVVGPQDGVAEFGIDPGTDGENAYNVTYLDAQSGTTYQLQDSNDSVVFEATAGSPVTLEDGADDADTMTIVRLSGGSVGAGGGGGGGGGLIALQEQGNLGPLLVVFLGLAGLVVVGRDPEAVETATTNLGRDVGGAVGQVPVVGPLLGQLLAGLLAALGGFAAAVGQNRAVIAAAGAALALAAIQADIIQLPEGSLVIVLVAGVAILSFLALRELGEFSTERWAGIVVATAVVAISVTSEGDPLTAVIESRAFPLVAIGGLYLAYRFVQALRQPDEETTIVVAGQQQGGGGEQ